MMSLRPAIMADAVAMICGRQHSELFAQIHSAK